MPKNWWFKFDFKVWRTDSELRRCSFETRGFWLECLCVMHESDTFKVSGTYEELGWLIGCSPDVVAKCSVELQRTKAANVTLGNGTVTLVSRRLKRELSDREQTRLRVKRYRSNGDVTDLKRDRVISKSKSNKKEVKTNTEEAAGEACVFGFPTDLLDSLKNYLGVVQMPNEPEWLGLADFAEVNRYTVEQVLDCYKFLESQPWRTGAISPKAMETNLPKFVRETMNPQAKFDIDLSSLQTQ